MHLHQHLKVVELHEFRWFQIDPEIAFFIFRNAKVLEKMIIKPSSSRRKRALKHCANMLKDKLPQGVDLVVGSLWFTGSSLCYYENKDITSIASVHYVLY